MILDARDGRWRDGSAMVGRRFIGDYGGEIMKASTITFLALAITISGCSVTTNDPADGVPNQVSNDMMQAKNAYTECLRENSAEPKKCAGLKEAYEANLQAYRATSGGGVTVGNYFAPSNK